MLIPITPKPWFQKLYDILYAEARQRGVPEALSSQYVQERITYLILIIWNLDENERMALMRLFPPAPSESLFIHDWKVRVCMLACEEKTVAWNDISIERVDKLLMVRSRKDLELERQILASLYPIKIEDITETCFRKLITH
jgi:hypothetical protein